MVFELVGNQYLYFDEAVEVKTNPLKESFNAWGVCVAPNSHLFVMDSEERWHFVNPLLKGDEVVMEHLQERVTKIYSQFKGKEVVNEN